MTSMIDGDPRRRQALRAQDIGYLPRLLMIFGFPHRRTTANALTRKAGNFRFVLQGIPKKDLQGGEVPLPFGAYPRLIVAWVMTQVFREKSREIYFPQGVRQFLRVLGIEPDNHTARKFRIQLDALLSCSISFRDMRKSNDFGKSENGEPVLGLQTGKYKHFNFEESAFDFGGDGKWGGKMIVNQVLYDEMIKAPAPFSLLALQKLHPASMAMDLYLWLTYRMAVLQKQQPAASLQNAQYFLLPWPLLQSQMSAGYAETSEGRKGFKRAVIRNLERVQLVYPEAQVSTSMKGIILHSSSPHIPFNR